MPYIFQLKRQTILISFILLFATIFSILYQGYYFGEMDGSLYIPYLKSLADPSLYHGDLFVQSWKAVYFANLWRVLAFLIGFISVQNLFLTLHIISRFCFFTSIYFLSNQLFKNRFTFLLTVILWAIPKPSLGFAVFYNEFVQAEVGLPVLIFSLYFFFRQSYYLSFILLGIAFHIHPPMAGYLALALFVALLMQKKLIPLLQFVLITSLLASPILIQTYFFEKSSTGFDSSWIDITRIRSPHHSFPLLWEVSAWLPFLLYTLIFLISLFFAFKKLDQRNSYLAIIFTMFLIIISGFIFSSVWPVPKLIAAVPFHIAPVVSILMSLTIIYLISLLLREKGDLLQALAIAFFTLFFFNFFTPGNQKALIEITAVSILFTFIIYLFNSRFKKLTFAITYLITFITLCTIIWIPFMLKKNLSNKNVFINNWVETQIWVKSNSNKNDVIIAPIYLDGFRVFSERSIVGDWKDGSGGYLSPGFLKEWWKRMELLGLTKTQFSDSYQKQIYRNLEPSKIEDLAKKYKANYFVVENGFKQYNYKLVYKNSSFSVYKLK